MHLLSTLSEPLIYIVAFSIIFAETGILACFFFPGDTLLFSLGIFAKQGIVSFSSIVLVLIGAAIAGNILGYYLGSFVRNKHHQLPVIKKVPDKHVFRTEQFYLKYGTLTVIISRFIPIVRTIAPFLAGVSKMNYRRYLVFSIIGGALWIITISSFGFVFGGYVSAEKAVFIAILLMTVATVLTPLVVYFFRRMSKKS